jgi:hypothetical protein
VEQWLRFTSGRLKAASFAAHSILVTADDTHRFAPHIRNLYTKTNFKAKIYYMEGLYYPIKPQKELQSLMKQAIKSKINSRKLKKCKTLFNFAKYAVSEYKGIQKFNNGLAYRVRRLRISTQDEKFLYGQSRGEIRYIIGPINPFFVCNPEKGFFVIKKRS